MRRGIQGPGGLFVYSSPDGEREVPTFTCCHCNGIHPVPPKDSIEMGFCRNCHARECIECARKNRCVPFEKALERYEKKMALRAAIDAG